MKSDGKEKEEKGREQELIGVELAKMIAKENVSGIDRGGEIAAKKDAKRSGLGQEKTDEGDGKENYKYKENGSQTVAFQQKVSERIWIIKTGLSLYMHATFVRRRSIALETVKIKCSVENVCFDTKCWMKMFDFRNQ